VTEYYRYEQAPAALSTPLRRRYAWLGVEWAADSPAAALQHVRVEHGGTDVLVSQEFLHRADIVAIFQQMCGEGMATLIVTLLIMRR
jgi:hypothetical protein